MNELQMNLIQRKTAEARDEALAEGMSKGIDLGITQGIAQNQNDIVSRMIGNHFSIENISDITGIPLDLVKKIATQL